MFPLEVIKSSNCKFCTFLCCSREAKSCCALEGGIAILKLLKNLELMKRSEKIGGNLKFLNLEIQKREREKMQEGGVGGNIETS